jgi:hypothetical protein
MFYSRNQRIVSAQADSGSHRVCVHCQHCVGSPSCSKMVHHQDQLPAVARGSPCLIAYNLDCHRKCFLALPSSSCFGHHARQNTNSVMTSKTLVCAFYERLSITVELLVVRLPDSGCLSDLSKIHIDFQRGQTHWCRNCERSLCCEVQASG